MILKYTRINENFKPKVTIDKLTPVGERCTLTTEKGRFYYQQHADEAGNMFYTFGLDGIDQWWSSNAATINELFGLDITECSIRELQGKYPDSWTAGYGIARKDLQLPDCLEWRAHWGDTSILPKKGIELPSGNDYFRSTTIDAQGVLLDPKQ